MSRRREIEEVLFPELTDMTVTSRARLEFAVDVEGQIRRVASLIAAELNEVADWQWQDVAARADEWNETATLEEQS